MRSSVDGSIFKSYTTGKRLVAAKRFVGNTKGGKNCLIDKLHLYLRTITSTVASWKIPSLPPCKLEDHLAMIQDFVTLATLSTLLLI